MVVVMPYCDGLEARKVNFFSLPVSRKAIPPQSPRPNQTARPPYAIKGEEDERGIARDVADDLAGDARIESANYFAMFRNIG
jgi:hypothetical protein